MHLLLAFDSFKESLSSLQAARCFQTGFKKVLPDAEIETILLSDGGEGFVSALTFQNGELQKQKVTGPLGNPVNAQYGLMRGDQSAVIEMAAASGLELVPRNQRNPLKTTSYGTGELIRHAISQGAKRIFIGIGGSATVDGGLGMAQALGVEFFEQSGKKLQDVLCGADLQKIGRVSLDSLADQIKQLEVIVACDVNNPWIGELGAARIFGPQKGATAEMIEELERGMENLAAVIRNDLGSEISSLPGAGAAGGLGGMLYALLGAKLKSGIEIVLESVGFIDAAKKADLIITGEGRVDSQTIRGKTINGVTKIARNCKVPILVIGGSIVEKDLPLLYDSGIDMTLSLLSTPTPLEEAIQNGAELMRQTGERVGRMVRFLPRNE
ncbi:MAG: glycerate kinase [SAR324 cluster bacterium]|nr:glycerate kinase [SAR324 cluster bacterium]